MEEWLSLDCCLSFAAALHAATLAAALHAATLSLICRLAPDSSGWPLVEAGLAFLFWASLCLALAAALQASTLFCGRGFEMSWKWSKDSGCAYRRVGL